jgi:hypothetical protein
MIIGRKFKQVMDVQRKVASDPSKVSPVHLVNRSLFCYVKPTSLVCNTIRISRIK